MKWQLAVAMCLVGPASTEAQRDCRAMNVEPTIKVDEFDGTRAVHGSSIELSGRASLSIGITHVQAESGRSYLMLVALYEAPEWLFIREFEGLRVKLGATITSPRMMGTPSRSTISSGGIREIATFDAPKDLLNTLARDTTITIRLTGTEGVRDYKWTILASCAVERALSVVDSLAGKKTR